MGDVERRIDLAFDLLVEIVKDPTLAEAIPDEAIVGVGDEADPTFTEKSRKLLRNARLGRLRESTAPRGGADSTLFPHEVMVIRRRGNGDADHDGRAFRIASPWSQDRKGPLGTS